MSHLTPDLAPPQILSPHFEQSGLNSKQNDFDRYTALKMENHHLRKTIQELKSAHSEGSLIVKVNQYALKSQELEKQLLQKEALLTKARDMITNLQADMRLQEGERKEMFQAEVKRLTQVVLDFDNKVSTLDSMNAEIVTQLENKERDIMETRKQYEQCCEQNTKILKLLKKERQERQSLQTYCAQLEEERKQWEKDSLNKDALFQKLERAKIETQQKLGLLQKETNNMEVQLKESMEQAEAIFQQNQQQQHRLNQAKNIEEDLRREINRLHSVDTELKETKERHKKQSQKLEQLYSEISEERRAKELSSKYLSMVKIRLSGIVSDILTAAGLLNEFRRQKKRPNELNRSAISMMMETNSSRAAGFINNYKVVQELMDEIDQFYSVHQIVQRLYECFFQKQRELLVDRFNTQLEGLWSKIERLQHQLTDLSFAMRKRKARELDLKQELRFKEEEIQELRDQKHSPLFEQKQNYGGEKSILPRISREFESFQRQILRDITERQNK